MSQDLTKLLTDEIEALCLRRAIPISEAMLIQVITEYNKKKEKKEKAKDK